MTHEGEPRAVRLRPEELIGLVAHHGFRLDALLADERFVRVDDRRGIARFGAGLRDDDRIVGRLDRRREQADALLRLLALGQIGRDDDGDVVAPTREQLDAQLDRIGRAVLALGLRAQVQTPRRIRAQLGKTLGQPSFAREPRQQIAQLQPAELFDRVPEVAPCCVTGEENPLVREVDVVQLGLRALEEPQQRAARFELFRDGDGNRAQRAALRASQHARAGVHDAQRAEREALGRAQRNAGVETDAGLARHQRVLGEPRVGRRVVDLHDPLVEDGVRAERALARSLAQFDPMRGFEPLPIAIDQRDQGDRDVAQLRGEVGERVEEILGRRVEEFVLVEGGEPSLLSRRGRRRGRHAKRALVSNSRRRELPQVIGR